MESTDIFCMDFEENICRTCIEQSWKHYIILNNWKHNEISVFLWMSMHGAYDLWFMGVPTQQKLLRNSEGMHSLIILWNRNRMYEIIPEGLESMVKYGENKSEKKAVKKEWKNLMLERY